MQYCDCALFKKKKKPKTNADRHILCKDLVTSYQDALMGKTNHATKLIVMFQIWIVYWFVCDLGDCSLFTSTKLDASET